MHPLLPLTILGAMASPASGTSASTARGASRWRRSRSLLAVNTWGAWLSVFRYGAHDVEKEPGHAEMLAYVQTSKDLVRSLSAVEQARSRVAPGQNVITVAGESAVAADLVPARRADDLGDADRAGLDPVIVADWDPEGALEKQLAQKYDAKRVPIRAWWFPEAQDRGRKDAADAQGLLPLVALPRDLEPDRVAGRDGLRPQGPRRQRHARAARARRPGHLRPRLPVRGDELPAARVFGGPGTGPGQFAEPRGVAADGRGNLYVADSKNSRIEIFDGNGAFLRALGGIKGGGDGQLNEPCGVAVGPDGEIYVADTWNHRVARFSADGQWLGEWKDPERGFFGPRALVSREGLPLRHRHRQQADRALRRGGTRSRPPGAPRATGPGSSSSRWASRPTPPGRIYVADTGNHRIQVFEGDGAFVRQFPVYGWKDFYTEPYLAIGPSDSVFVTDSWKGRIAQYDAAGNLRKSYKADGLKSPTGIALDPVRPARRVRPRARTGSSPGASRTFCAEGGDARLSAQPHLAQVQRAAARRR